MDRLRLIIVVLATGAALWWLYPHREAAINDNRTEVTIWFNGPIEGRQLAAIDAFEKRFPKYRAILGSSAARTGLDGEGNPQRLMCGIAGGVPPEVVEYDRFAVCQWASRKAFLDINPLMEKDKAELENVKAQLAQNKEANASADLQKQIAFLESYAVRAEDYYPQTWNECTWQGGQYGVPNYMDDRVLYYNADLLVQNGFVNAKGEPVLPDTWEQVCRKRVEVTDATIRTLDKKHARITSASTDFKAAGVKTGDTLSHITTSGVVTRCLVASIDSPSQITVKSAYAARDLALPDKPAQQIKIFDQDSYCLRLSRWDDEGRMRVVGFEPQHGNGWLYMYGWMNGGEFLSDDGLTCTLDDPKIVEALQWTTDVYDSMGGVQDVNAFKKSFQPGAQDPFFMNQIGLFINGDWFLRDLGRYARDMKFGTYPAPVPANRIGGRASRTPSSSETELTAATQPGGQDARPPQDGRNFTWVAGFAYCIPSTCPPEKLEAAWALVKFLSSVEGGMTMNEHDAQRERGQGRLYVPRLAASIPFNKAQFDHYVNIPEMPQRLRAGLQTHVDMLPYGRYRPVSPEGKKLWDGQATAQDLAWNHKHTPAESLRLQKEQVQHALDRFYNPPKGAIVHWKPLIGVYAVALVAFAAVIYVRHRARNKVPGYMRKEWLTGVLFAMPWVIGFIVLSGGPMIFSAVMSFTQYDVLSPAVFIGAQNYVDLATPGKDPLFLKSLGNTLFMAIGVPIGMIVGLGLAMLLDTKVRGMSVYRTLYFLPAIMPVVAASVLWIWVFNAQNGMMNWMLHLTGIEAIIDWANRTFDTGLKTPISWLTSEKTAKPALIIMGLWGAGASMIIWLAGLKEIPTHLYEAAALDGAGPVRRFFNITLPMLSPYILFNLIMGLIGTFQIFTQAYIMTPNGSPSYSTYFYVYKLFDECFSYFRLGYGAAMAWVLFVMVIMLTLLNMALSKKWVHYGGE